MPVPSSRSRPRTTARAFSGLFLGLYGATSLIAGLGYGALKERMPLHHRLMVSVTLFAAGGIPLLAARGLFSLIGLLPLAGVAMAPATVTAMEVMQRVVPPAMLTQTISWDTTAIAFGMTAGSFLAGGDGPSTSLSALEAPDKAEPAVSHHAWATATPGGVTGAGADPPEARSLLAGPGKARSHRGKRARMFRFHGGQYAS